jgi:hypothetical protein
MMIFLVAFYETLLDDSLYLLWKRAHGLYLLSPLWQNSSIFSLVSGQGLGSYFLCERDRPFILLLQQHQKDTPCSISQLMFSNFHELYSSSRILYHHSYMLLATQSFVMMIFLVAFYESSLDDSLYLLRKRALSFIASLAKLVDFFFGFWSG